MRKFNLVILISEPVSAVIFVLELFKGLCNSNPQHMMKIDSNRQTPTIQYTFKPNYFWALYQILIYLNLDA